MSNSMNKMFGLQITESQYRQLPVPSYSLLSDIEQDGPIVITRPRLDISLDEPVIIGSIADNYLTDGDNIKPMFVVGAIPSDKPKLIIEELVEREAELTNFKDILHKDNKDFIDAVCEKHDYYKNYVTRIKYLNKFKSFIKVIQSNQGERPFIVTNYQKSQADRVVSAVKRTFPFFNYKHNLGQVKLKGIINGQELKSMFDMILVDKANKRLIPFDLKTGMERYDCFEKGNFLTFNYYLQAALYKEILIQNLPNSIFKDWKVEDFRFLYCSRTDFQPIIFRVTPEIHKASLEGFTTGSVRKKGLYELIEEYKFYSKYPTNPYRMDYIKEKNGRLILEKDITL